MKQLLLMRHAKSSWADEGMDDHDRPLNDRGRRDAPRMAEYLAEAGVRPDQIVASTARRVVETLAGMEEGLGFTSGEVAFIPELYLATAEVILARGSAHAASMGDVDTLMLVGHNPGMEQTLAFLRGRGQAMPTAAVGICRLSIESWDELPAIPAGSAEVTFVRPRELH